jgi:hypothetical protein
VRHRLCTNCARFDPKDYEDADSWCFNEYDIRAQLEDYETDHCTMWLSNKHRLRLAAEKAVDCLKWRIEQRVSMTDDDMTQLLSLLERGLRK